MSELRLRYGRGKEILPISRTSFACTVVLYVGARKAGHDAARGLEERYDTVGWS